MTVYDRTCIFVGSSLRLSQRYKRSPLGLLDNHHGGKGGEWDRVKLFRVLLLPLLAMLEPHSLAQDVCTRGELYPCQVFTVVWILLLVFQ